LHQRVQSRPGSAPRSRPPSPRPPTRPQPFRLASVERHERYLSEVLPREAAKEWAREEERARQAAEARVRCCRMLVTHPNTFNVTGFALRLAVL
jgi:hypothetical protein